MPRSPASSPTIGNSSSNEEPAVKITSPSVAHHPGLTIPSPGDDDGEGSQRKKYKYTKPRIGSYFQAKVGPFLSQNDKEESEEWNDSLSNMESLGPALKKKKAGRPPKAMKTKQQQQQSESLVVSWEKTGDCLCLCFIWRPCGVPGALINTQHIPTSVRRLVKKFGRVGVFFSLSLIEVLLIDFFVLFSPQLCHRFE
jgi:hypothetical protein